MDRCRRWTPDRLSVDCAFRKLNPIVLVMKSTEDGLCKDVSERLDWARMWRVLCQSEMRPDLVVVSSIGFEDPAQVAFAHDRDMIQV